MHPFVFPLATYFPYIALAIRVILVVREGMQRPLPNNGDQVENDDWWIVNETSHQFYAEIITSTAAMRVRKRASLLRFALNHVKVRNGQYLEFGVHEGKDIVRMAAFATQEKKRNGTDRLVFHGFDSFQGLPEDWDNGQMQTNGESLAFVAGTFDLDGVVPGVKDVQKRINLGKFQASEGSIVLHPGWFEDTVPIFFATQHAPIAFVHADADLYSSTITFLDEMCKHNLLVKGTVIVFDEYVNHENWEQGEYQAWMEVCRKYWIDFEYICYHAPAWKDRTQRCSYGYQSVGVVVTSVESNNFATMK